MPLTRENKILALITGILLPYMAFVFYLALRVPQHPLPEWFPFFGGLYLFVALAVVMLVSRRIQRGAPPQETEKARRARKLGRVIVTYLILVWSLLFLYGAYNTLKGDYPMSRALPAGGTLLLFIGLFSWALYRDRKM